MGEFDDGYRNDWVFSHVYPDGLRPGVLVTERLILREGSGLCRWSRLLDTNDDKGVRAQGECWRRHNVKNVRFSSKVGDPSREFSLFGERQEVKKRVLFGMAWEKAPVFTACMCFVLNPLSLALLCSGSLCLALWSAFPRDGTRYVMSASLHAEPLGVACALTFFAGLTTLSSSWWLRLGGKKVTADDAPDYSTMRPHAAAISRWCWQRPLNGVMVGLLSLYYAFVFIMCPIFIATGRKSDNCVAGSCESGPGNVDGRCGVGSCSCGSMMDLSCSLAKDLPTYCRSVDAPICAADSSEASGVHQMLLLVMGGTLLATLLLFLIWLVNHLAIALSWKKVSEQLVSPLVKPEHVPYHRVTLTFDSQHQGSLRFTLGGDEDVALLAKLLMPDSNARSYSNQLDFVPPYAPPPLGTFAGAGMWPGEYDEQDQWSALLDNPSTQDVPADLQWD
eukprot:gb/GFBE01057175.1/.p1 GENE.gb/GFBE01057175.1/~~gb/GFBE01057175.1/.p1  ORF type:complete len:448 (+),score=70.73 gb/GFBE01057175.1/:1-1344(+)